MSEEKIVSDNIKVGKKVMIKATVIDDYSGNCTVKVRLNNGVETNIHLNDMQSHNLKPYTS